MRHNLKTAGMVLCASTGITAYVSELPLPCRPFCSDRPARRLLHGIAQLGAFFAVVIGYLLHFNLSAAKGESHIASGDSYWRQAHVWMGLITVLGMLTQTSIGIYKYVVRTREGKAIYKWHGYLGLGIWIGGCITIAIAFYGVFWADGTRPGITIGAWILLALLVLFTCAVVFMDPSRRAVQERGFRRGTGLSGLDDTSDIFDGARDSMGSLNGKPLLA
jgi:hypothetical protein